MNGRTLVLLLTLLSPSLATASECVVLLHGLARSADSMTDLENRLARAGYHVENIDYPSREQAIPKLAEHAVAEGLKRCQAASASPVNFVTHSLGGILVRYYYSHHSPENVGRVVMLGPPNQGSEVVDNLKDVPGFALLNGPAGRQLGTGESDIPRSLGPVNFELGVIAGTRSINLLLSTLLPNPDDGKVSVESARVEGMCGFITLPVTHPFMMKDDEVIRLTLHFLKQGAFDGMVPDNSCKPPPAPSN
ncbi:MAG: alpha/beta fold hydrolase [Sedimenticola sp.]|nr:alpha/beta fold hydrolase [Sedimenticola sp.]